MKKAIQYFTNEYLEQCKQMTPLQIAQYLDDYRKLFEKKSNSILISIKIPEDLLSAFKKKSDICEVKYQTQIKKLMRKWLEE